MRTSDLDILIVPGHRGAGPDHWQSRWQQKLSTARRVSPRPERRALREAWSEALIEALERATRPAIIVAHDIGVIATAQAAALLDAGRLRGAFLVAPPSREAIRAMAGVEPSFADIPSDPLPFPSLLVASRTDPLASFAESEDLSYAWGSALVDAGESGHIDDASGHGPWPEGLMRLAGFLSKL
jgi:predicted alpha/beta hydrolase family esterase